MKIKELTQDWSNLEDWTNLRYLGYFVLIPKRHFP